MIFHWDLFLFFFLEAAAEPQAQQSKPEPAKKPEEPISTFVDPYNYEQLLALIIGILKEKNPQLGLLNIFYAHFNLKSFIFLL